MSEFSDMSTSPIEWTNGANVFAGAQAGNLTPWAIDRKDCDDHHLGTRAATGGAPGPALLLVDETGNLRQAGSGKSIQASHRRTAPVIRIECGP
jgi:hypothetical protein